MLFLQNEAKGKLYVDDGHSFDYKKGSFLLREFTFSNNKLTARYTHIHFAADSYKSHDNCMASHDGHMTSHECHMVHFSQFWRP